MATDVHIGITLVAGSLIEEVEVGSKKDKHVLKDSNGEDARVCGRNSTKSFSVKGHGALVIVPGIGTSGISSIAGGVTFVDEVKYTEKNADWDGWSYNGTHHPGAQPVA
jgi:hypothetical protein